MASPIAKFPQRSHFRIEKGIPLPVAKSSYLPLDEMSIGDSFFVADGVVTQRAVQGAIRRYERNTAKNFSMAVKFTTRKVDGGLRVWRAK